MVKQKSKIYSIVSGDKRLESIVKKLEDFIEIKFDMIDVRIAISALAQCFPQNNISQKTNETSNTKWKKFLESNEEIIKKLLEDYEKNKNPIQEIRDILWDIKSKIGVVDTLMFINSHLMLSLEMILSGAIITYAKAFASSKRRTTLNEKIFRAPELKDYHNYIIELRNQHYAHAELKYNEHILSLLYKDTGLEIEFQTDSHRKSSFCESMNYKLFDMLAREVIHYLDKEIITKINYLKENLTEEQLEELKKLKIKNKKPNKALHLTAIPLALHSGK